MMLSVFFPKAAATITLGIVSAQIASAQNVTIWNELTFEEIDPIAKAVLNEAQKLSFQNNLEYCGYIAYDREGTLRATLPIAGEVEECETNAPEGWELVASYHTHGAVDLDHPKGNFELPSPSDIYADMEEGVDGYLATPGGRLWFIDSLDATAHLIGEPGSMPSDPNFVENDCPPLVAHTLEELEYMEKNGIGPCKL